MNDFPSFTPTQVHRVGPDQYETSHGADRDLIAQFEMLPVHMAFKSEQEGRPIYEERPHLRIAFPGDRTRELLRPVKMQDDALGPSDLNRFPQQWAAFQAQCEPVVEGTPLAEWPLINRAQVLEFAALNIRTVEQLASVPDTTLHTMGMGGRTVRDKAKAWLDKARGGSELSRIMARLEALENENAALRRQQAAVLTDPVTGDPLPPERVRPSPVSGKRIRRTRAEIEAARVAEALQREAA